MNIENVNIMSNSISAFFSFPQRPLEEEVMEQRDKCSAITNMLYGLLSDLEFSVDVEIGDSFQINMTSLNFVPEIVEAELEMNELKAATVKLMECVTALQKASKPKSFYKEAASVEPVSQVDSTSESSLPDNLDALELATEKKSASTEQNGLDLAEEVQSAIEPACEKILYVFDGEKFVEKYPNARHHTQKQFREIDQKHVKEIDNILKLTAEKLNMQVYCEICPTGKAKKADTLVEKPNLAYFDRKQLKENLTRFPKSEASLQLNTIPKYFPECLRPSIKKSDKRNI